MTAVGADRGGAGARTPGVGAAAAAGRPAPVAGRRRPATGRPHPSASRRHPAIWVLMVVGMALLAAAAGCGQESPGPSPSPERVVARVRGEPVTDSQVRTVRRLASLSGEEVSATAALDQAIKEEIVRQEATRLGVKVPDAAVRKRMARLSAELGGAEELRRRLRDAGLTAGELRAGVAAALLADRLQDARFPEVRGTSAEARRLYRARPDLFTTPAEVELADLAVRTEAIARDVVSRIGKGQSFASAARQFSADPELRAKEGMVGWVVLDSLPREARAALAGLSVGELSRPVLLGNLWHVFQLLDRRAARTVPFGEVREEIVAALTRRKRSQALARWLAEARSDPRIVVTLASPAD